MYKIFDIGIRKIACFLFVLAFFGAFLSVVLTIAHAQTPSTTAILKTKEDAEKVREQNEPPSQVQNIQSQSLPADLPSTSFISQFTPLPNRQGRFYADTIVHNGYVYTVGGEYDFFRDGQLYSDIDYGIVSARIRSDGSVGPWKKYPHTSIPLSGPPYIRINPSVAVVNGILFSIGGHRDRGIVYATRISPDANLGPWSELEPLPEAFVLTKVVSNRDFVFVLGGRKMTGGGVWDDCCNGTIYRTRTHSDGTINGWTHIADLPKELFRKEQYPYIAAYVNNDYLYVAGNGKIFFTSINSDGSLGSWQGPIDSPTRAFSLVSLLVYNNLLVVFGLDNVIYSIPINSDGSLGVPGTVDNGWRTDQVQLPLGTANILFDPFIENNRLYLYVSNVDLYFYPAVPPRAFYVANLSNSPTGPVPSPVPVPPPDISIRNAANDSLIATWMVPTANRGTWLSIARTSDQSNQYISRVWANTCRGGNDEPTNISLQISAECTLPKPSTPGIYEVRLYESNNFNISARSDQFSTVSTVGVLNGGFEDTANPLAEWTCQPDQDACSIDSSVKHSGNRSVKVSFAPGKTNSWGYQLLQQGIYANRGEQLCLSYWLKKGFPYYTAVGVGIQESANPWRAQETQASAVRNTTDWQHIQETVNIGNTWTTPIQLYLRSRSHGDTNWFDDITLVRGACIEPTPTPTPPVTPTPTPAQTAISIGNTSSNVSQLTINWSLSNTNRESWISIAKVTDAANSFVSWVWANTCVRGNGEPNVTARNSGVCTLTKPTTPGIYEVRLFGANNTTILARSVQFTVTPSSVNVTVPATGVNLTAQWNLPNPNQGSWISVAQIGSRNNSYASWVWANTCLNVRGEPNVTPNTSGTCTLSKPTRRGTYEVRLYNANNYTITARSAQFSIQ